MSDPASIDDRIEAAVVKAEGGAQIYHDAANGPAGSYISTESGPLPTIAEWYAINEEALGNLPAIEGFIEDIQDKTNPANGTGKIGHLGRFLSELLGEVVNIRDAPYSVTGNNTTLDHNNLVACLDAAAAAGKPVIVPAGLYLFNDWISLPDKLKLVFMPGAKWKLTVGGNVLGGFVCGGYTQSLAHRPFTEVEIYGIDLDCSDIPGQNAFNAINGVNVKLYNPKIRNVKFSPTTQGGKAFQFEGDTVDGIHIYNPYIENCTIGINSHADPFGGTEKARFITYYNVVMRDVEVPFNCDGQFANPEAGTTTNMNTTVRGANLFNCGKLTYSGNSGALGAGIVCGDRGFGLHISGVRVINTVAYGAIGAVVRGTLFGANLSDFKVEAPSMAAVIDFTQVGYGASSSGAHPCTVVATGFTVLANLDYIVKGGVNGKVGNCQFDITINSATASLTGICDSAATFNGLGVLNLRLANTAGRSTGPRSLISLFVDGNTDALCFPEVQEGAWTPVDVSGAGLALVLPEACRYVRRGRVVTANMRVTYPTTANASPANIGGLPFTSSPVSPMAGNAAVAYTTEPTLNAGYVIGGGISIQLSTASGGSITNATLSGDSIYMTITYLAQ